MTRLLPLLLLTACAPVAPPPAILAPVVYAQPSCQGMVVTTLWTSTTSFGVACCRLDPSDTTNNTWLCQ